MDVVSNYGLAALDRATQAIDRPATEPSVVQARFPSLRVWLQTGKSLLDNDLRLEPIGLEPTTFWLQTRRSPN